MNKTVHATIRISSENHGVSLHMNFKKDSTLLEKFQQIHETISDRNFLNGGNDKLESIYFFESEEVLKCTE